MGCHSWHTALHSFRLHRLQWIFCPGHVAVRENERADRLASTADVNLICQGRYTQGLSNFLNVDRPEHHLKERGMEKGSGRHTTVASTAASDDDDDDDDNDDDSHDDDEDDDNNDNDISGNGGGVGRRRRSNSSSSSSRSSSSMSISSCQEDREKKDIFFSERCLLVLFANWSTPADTDALSSRQKTKQNKQTNKHTDVFLSLA